MATISKRLYYRLYSLLHDENAPYEDRRERKIITNKFLLENGKADISELTNEEAENLIEWLVAVC